VYHECEPALASLEDIAPVLDDPVVAVAAAAEPELPSPDESHPYLADPISRTRGMVILPRVQWHMSKKQWHQHGQEAWGAVVDTWRRLPPNLTDEQFDVAVENFFDAAYVLTAQVMARRRKPKGEQTVNAEAEAERVLHEDIVRETREALDEAQEEMRKVRRSRRQAHRRRCRGANAGKAGEASQSTTSTQETVPDQLLTQQRSAEARVRQAERQRKDSQAWKEARNLQREYDRSPRKVLTRILNKEQQTPECSIPEDRLAEYFAQVHAPCSVDLDDPHGKEVLGRMRKRADLVPEDDRQGLNAKLVADVDQEEVADQLKRLPYRSAPGPDGITYAMLKRLPEMAGILATIYSRCMRTSRIPEYWKTSITTLIYKKGDAGNPGNWRPINLQSAVYKVYAAILARRTASWAIATKAISNTQKGFMPYNGTTEHSFLLETVINNGRDEKKARYMTWYDLKNAFGSVSHELIMASLRASRMPEQICDAVANIYHGATFAVRMGRVGLTRLIANNRGVKQGCPFSPILFNFCLEGLLCSLSNTRIARVEPGVGFPGTEKRLNHLAYADDLVLFTADDGEMRTLHRATLDFMAWAKVEVNAAKCATLAMKLRNRSWTTPRLELMVEGATIPTLSYSERYKYLGIQTDAMGIARRGQLVSYSKDIARDLKVLFNSPLRTHQKMHAAKVFILSRLDYFVRNGRPTLREMDSIDRELVRGIRKDLKLPISATKSFIFTQMAAGGLGFVSARDLMRASRIAQAVGLLNSQDPLVREVALGDAHRAIQRRYMVPAGTELGLAHAVSLLNGTVAAGPNDDVDRRHHRLLTPKERHADRQSLFTDCSRYLPNFPNVRAFLHHDRDVSADEYVALGEEVGKPFDRKKVVRALRAVSQMQSERDWDNLSLQKVQKQATGGKNAGTEWINRARGVSQSTYSFAFRARLDVLPTNANIARSRRGREAGSRVERIQIAGAAQVAEDAQAVGMSSSQAHNHISTELVTRANPTAGCRCGAAYESNAHIFSMCDRVRPLYTARHDQIVNRVAAMLRRERRESDGLIIRVDQIPLDWPETVPPANEPERGGDLDLATATTEGPRRIPALRPDLQIIDENKKLVDIVDVAVVYATAGTASFDAQRRYKETKYASVAQHYRRMYPGYDVRTNALIYGALGQVDDKNQEVYKRLCLAVKSTQWMERYIVTGLLHAGNQIWQVRCREEHSARAAQQQRAE